MATKSWVVSAVLAGMVMASEHAARAEQPTEARSSRDQAVSAIATMERSSDRVRTLLRRARQASRSGGPISAISCVNEGLSQVDVTVRSARERSQSMTQAYARGDAAAARRELAQIAWQRVHVRDLEASSESCLDPRFSHVKEGTTVTVIIDPTIPRDG